MKIRNFGFRYLRSLEDFASNFPILFSKSQIFLSSFNFPSISLSKLSYSSIIPTKMGQRLNDLLHTLHLYHLQTKDCVPSLQSNQSNNAEIHTSTSDSHHRIAVSIGPTNRLVPRTRYPQSTRTQVKKSPLRLIHQYRPIKLLRIQQDSRPSYTSQPSPIRSPRSPTQTTLITNEPPGTLFLRTIHKSPKLRRRTHSPHRASRIISELRRAQEAKERRFDAIIADVTAEFRLQE